jgi:hypothetical protein
MKGHILLVCNYFFLGYLGRVPGERFETGEHGYLGRVPGERFETGEKSQEAHSKVLTSTSLLERASPVSLIYLRRGRGIIMLAFNQYSASVVSFCHLAGFL